MSKTHILAQADKDWADEFSCEYFGVYTKEQWNEFCKKVKDAWGSHDDIEVSFGTNESLSFSSYADWLQSFTVKAITEEEANAITKNLGETFGTGSGALTYILEILNRDGEDSDL